MGPGFIVVPEELTRASRAAFRDAETVREVPLSEAADLIAWAMPGSRSADVALDLALRWRAELGEWSAALTGYATDLAATADLYVSTDAATDAQLRHLDGGLAGMPGSE